MGKFGSRRGFADRLSLPLMILAFLAVIGFLYWLNITAEPTQVAIVEERMERTSGASAILNVTDFLSDASQYEGQLIEVTEARVASRLGEGCTHRFRPSGKRGTESLASPSTSGPQIASKVSRAVRRSSLTDRTATETCTQLSDHCWLSVGG